MIVWNLLLAVHHLIVAGGWILILSSDMFLRNVPPYSRRMMRGKYSKWSMKTFGLLGDLPVRMVVGGGGLAGAIATDSAWFITIFYLYLLSTLIVDWITGSEDPPWRRWAKSGAELLKKLRWQPAPQPAVNL